MYVVSTRQVATLLNCSVRSVLYMVERGELTPVVKHKRFFMFDKDEVLTIKAMRDERRA